LQPDIAYAAADLRSRGMIDLADRPDLLAIAFMTTS
jgi:hypothetical protein